MQDLPSGKYDIFSSVAPGPPIGADNRDNCIVKPVITNGEMKTWLVEKQPEGLYKLVLDEVFHSSKEGDKVEVKFGGDPGILWKLTQVGPDSYLIKSTDANTAWTVTSVDPKSPVVLKFLTGPVNDDQIFRFVPSLED